MPFRKPDNQKAAAFVEAFVLELLRGILRELRTRDGQALLPQIKNRKTGYVLPPASTTGEGSDMSLRVACTSL